MADGGWACVILQRLVVNFGFCDAAIGKYVAEDKRLYRCRSL